MQILHCNACKSQAPLNPPSFSHGAWYARCGECMTEHRLEAITANVFLPVRFRVARAAQGANALGKLLCRDAPAD